MCISGKLFCQVCEAYIKEDFDTEFKLLFEKCKDFEKCSDEEFKHITIYVYII
jgi:hypothetical protein